MKRAKYKALERAVRKRQDRHKIGEAHKYSNTNILVTEKSFIKNALAQAKEYMRSAGAEIKKKGRAIVKDVQKRFSQDKQRKNFEPGSLITFKYKAKDQKQRYDKQPLAIILGPPRNPKLQKTHVYGLNIHWMPRQDRVKVASFFVNLLEARKGQLQYQDVAPFIEKFKGHQVLRLYIIKNISSRVIQMPNDVFLKTAAIDTAQWFKG